VAEQLRPEDRSSLQSEVGPVNMAVGGLLVFEGGDGTSYDAVADRLDRRLHLVPKYRQRLRTAPLGPLSGPVWVDDDAFDLHWHLRRATVSGFADLQAYVARDMSRKLDRSRPLWEVHVVDGLPDGRRALWAKMHHALVDGIAAVGIAMLLLDPTPEPMELPEPEEEWQPRGYDLRSHLQAMARTPLDRAGRFMWQRTLRAMDPNPWRAAEEWRSAADLFGELARSRPQAPMTPLNRPIGPNRRFATASVELGRLKAAGRGAGGTVNDALLAVVAGALRDYLVAAGTDLRGRDPVALVPVSTRREDEGHTVGNRVSTVFVDLPVDEADAAARVRRISSQMRDVRRSAAIRAGELIAGATGQVPPLVSTILVRAIGNVRAMNLVVSNLPGPQQPFYMNGSRMQEVYPVVPLNPANQGLTIGILSYDGMVFVGLLADAKLDPPVEVIADALQAHFDALAKG